LHQQSAWIIIGAKNRNKEAVKNVTECDEGEIKDKTEKDEGVFNVSIEIPYIL